MKVSRCGGRSTGYTLYTQKSHLYIFSFESHSFIDICLLESQTIIRKLVYQQETLFFALCFFILSIYILEQCIVKSI